MAIADSHYFAQTKKIAYLSATLNLCLAIIKMCFGILGHSAALFADGIHSLSDLFCDGIVLIAAHYSAIPADDNHPYGHYRFETFASFALGFMLIVVGLMISYDSTSNIFYHKLDHPEFYTLWIAACSLILYELLYRYSIYIAKKINSDLLQATAWHNRADAITSLFVFLGLLATTLGYPMFDELAAILVGLFIFKVGLKYSLKAFRELTDEGLDNQQLALINQQVIRIPGVINSHELRTRKMGRKTVMDLHVQVAHYLSVSEGHYVADQVKNTIQQQFPSIKDITVHIDTETDHEGQTTPSLPSRESILTQLRPIWSNFIALDNITSVILHYHPQHITLELFLNDVPERKFYNNKTKLYEQFTQSIQSIPSIKQVQLYLKLSK